MRTSSPLRYPGGKSTLADLLGRIIASNGLGGHAIAEPYGGGAGAALTLLYLEYTKKIYVNDADQGIYSFWWSVTSRSEHFIERIKEANVSLTEWHRQRKIYKKRSGVSKLARGFATFFLNRCNRSGIIVNGGPIGGLQQKGKWKIDARFNRDDLVRRCRRVAEYSARISVSQRDGVEFLGDVDTEKTLYFIDPPYWENGANLYLDELDEEYHLALRDRLSEMKNTAWVLTYDNCKAIRDMYGDWAQVRPYSINYTSYGRRVGAEVLIVPKWMKLPETQSSRAVDW